MSCRIEPQIDGERQAYLASRLTITASVESGIYPFRDVKLSRADVEWLLATHRDRLEQVDREGACPRAHAGLDLRGALLQQVNLSELTLAGTQGGRSWLVCSAA